jgi:uncharacterized protein YjbI with pentapeptide repeats
MKTLTQLIEKLRSPDSRIATQAVEELRARGWLEDGALAGVSLCYVHLQNADLFRACLPGADLRQADLRWADLSLINLQGARLARANLYRADFSLADLRGADLFKANLQQARNLTADQLAQTARLRGAIMQDGRPYDGCFDLPGDDDFFGMTDVGPERAAPPALTGSETKAHLIRKLRSPNNGIVLQAVNAMQERGWLAEGVLERVQLRYAHLQRADLRHAYLHKTDLRMADLRGADLSKATLRGTRLSRADLQDANLFEADLAGAVLLRANLCGACHLTGTQLVHADKLRGATMPGGSRYDGRFNLPGDQGDARFLRVNLNDPAALADFYAVSIDDFLRGQAWAFVPVNVHRGVGQDRREIASVTLVR